MRRGFCHKRKSQLLIYRNSKFLFFGINDYMNNVLFKRLRSILTGQNMSDCAEAEGCERLFPCADEENRDQSTTIQDQAGQNEYYRFPHGDFNGAGDIRWFFCQEEVDAGTMKRSGS